NGISANRRTIPNDIAQLVEFGIDVIAIKSSQNLYFIGGRRFELPELKLLVDAVLASRFITEKKSETLIKKLSDLTSVHQAESLNRQLYLKDRIKPDNENIYYIVDMIHSAITLGKQMTFQYYEYTPNKQKELKHNGKVYVFSPYALLWNDDHYYIIGHSQSHEGIIKFRVDRICNPELTEAEAVPKPKDFDVAAYASKVFDMFDGRDVTVELLCENHLMKVIIDRFGEDVVTKTADEDHFFAKVSVSASPTFYSWIFQFCGEIKLISPKEAVEEYARMCNM
ncbi:MAG: WYL domain-containing protein, partial [Clostridia bacterium]|nr:WYL domain-containing protein [Clostridia bacterium]